MTDHDALSLLDDVRNFIYISFGTIELDENRSIYDCETDDTLFKYQFSIGVRDFTINPFEEFDVTDIMHPLVGMFHEVCGHGGQFVYEFNKETPLSKVLALNQYACKASHLYYGFKMGLPTEQYFRHPHEIAAQYAGIYGAYDFLSQCFSSKTVTDMICAYVNDRISHDSEFISSDTLYSSVDSILTDFNQTFQNSVFLHRTYIYDKNDPDTLLCHASLKRDISILTDISYCKNGLKQDYMAASVYLHHRDPSRRIQNCPALQDIDLSIGAAFRKFCQPIRPKPKGKDLHLTGLTNVRNLNLQLTIEDLQFAEIRPPNIEL